MLCLSHQDQFKISIAQSPISPLGLLTADSGLYGEAFGVFFEAQTVSMQPVLKDFSEPILWSSHFLSETVTTDRQMQNLDRLCNNRSRLILRKLETIVLIEDPLYNTGTAIILVCFIF